jgi:hypothetical protein
MEERGGRFGVFGVLAGPINTTLDIIGSIKYYLTYPILQVICLSVGLAYALVSCIMSELQDTSMSELSRIIKTIQSVNVENITQDVTAKAELLTLSKNLTAVLEGPLNRATDLVFKVS